MAQTLDSFIQNFKGGLRPNKFRVSHNMPGTGAPLLTYHIRAAAIPPSTMTTINVPYRGRIFKMPGIRTYSTWQMTVLDDFNNLHGQYHQWSHLMKKHYENVTTAAEDDFSSLMETITITQLNYNGDDVRTYFLHYAWPNNIGPIALDMENNENITTFTVDMEYQWISAPGSPGALPGGGGNGGSGIANG